MPTHPNRRQFLCLSAGVAAASTHYQIGPHVGLRWQNEARFSYRAHHRSLFVGCDQLNGGKD